MATSKSKPVKASQENSQAQSTTYSLSLNNVLVLLIAFRLINALTIRTFFQPDEYFQSLEPAWSIAFGEHSGAWITWEWREQLRSSLHPLLFAGVYHLADFAAGTLNLEPSTRAELLVAAPKILQAVFAALTDYFVWRLARQVYGKNSSASTAALFLTVLSPWQWFCATRTLSNSLETTLTATALLVWPFGTERTSASNDELGQVLSYNGRIRAGLALAAIATVLRPTNAIIWMVVATYAAISGSNHEPRRMIIKLLQECREAVISGVAVVAISIISDRLYYTTWTFPPARFVHFNVVQSLAVFYGRNRGDYYITEGLPLLLTTALPFAAIGCYKSFSHNTDASEKQTTQPLALTVAIFSTIMSLISHKEVRFMYPLLPALLVLSAGPFAAFFSPFPSPTSAFKRIALKTLIIANIGLAFYITQVHQRGVIDVLHHLRHEYEDTQAKEMTVMFMMPCHSTPWRSHLIHSGIEARALTCEPPIHVPIEARATYLDEADVFYKNPVSWMEENMEDIGVITHGDTEAKTEIQKRKWPGYLVFFEELRPVLEGYLGVTGYRECWRGFNTHWHDDGRRRGDVVVWCLK